MLIYLDIDGVMVAANSWRKIEILEDGFPEFSTRAVIALNKIITFSKASIVLTTSHKYQYTLEQWQLIFNKRNVLSCDIDRISENTAGLNRKNELIQWFDKNADRLKEDFIIIDDDKSLNALPYPLKDRLVQTSGSVGLTDYLADRALLLMEQLNFKLND